MSRGRGFDLGELQVQGLDLGIAALSFFLSARFLLKWLTFVRGNSYHCVISKTKKLIVVARLIPFFVADHIVLGLL